MVININKATKKEVNCLNIHGNQEIDPAILSQTFNCFFSTIAQKIKSKLINTTTLLINSTTIFNQSYFWNREFHDALKRARIIPIFKRGDFLQCNNYRPISLTSNISKMEKLAH